MSSNVGGHRFVLGLYTVLVAVTGAAGHLIETSVSGPNASRFLFLVPLPPTPASLATYGALTIALVLDIPSTLVVHVSAGPDDAA